MKKIFLVWLVYTIATNMSFASQQLGTGVDIKNGQNAYGNVLEVTDFAGTLIINNGTDNSIFLKGSGNDTTLNKIKIIQKDGTIEVLCTDPKNIEPLTVEITIPEATKLDVIMSKGRASIASIKRSATLDVTGDATIDAEAIEGGVSSTLRGNGAINIKSVKGTANLEVYGSGTITINKGSLNDLSSKIFGDGAIDCQCSVTNSMQADVKGSGILTVARNLGSAKVMVQGRGAVNLLQPQMDYLEAQVQGDGSIKAYGSTLGARLETHGKGFIGVEKITGTYTQRVLGSGTIKVNEPIDKDKVPAISAKTHKKAKTAPINRKKKLKRQYKERR